MVPHLITPDCISINISSYIYICLWIVPMIFPPYPYYSPYIIPIIPSIFPVSPWYPPFGVEGGRVAALPRLIIIYYYLSKKTDVESLQVHVMVMPFLPFWDLKTKNIDFVGREQWPEWHWLSASVGFEVHHLAVLLSGPSSTWNIKLCNNKQCNLFEKLHFCYCISKTNDSAFKIWCIQWLKTS